MNWEEGQIRTLTGTGAGNANISISPGAYKKWKLMYGFIKIVCDATVANRTVKFRVADASNVILTNTMLSGAVTASATLSVYVEGAPSQYMATVTNESTGMVKEFIVQGTDKFYISITNGVAGDVVTYNLRVIELPA